MSANSDALLAGIEAGGTKFVLAIAKTPSEILARHEIPTCAPDETLAEAADWFAGQGVMAAIGVGSFGPAGIDRNASHWGTILDTPKPGWSGCDLAGYFQSELGAPVEFETDVNAAALSEYQMGAGRGASGMAYITVGTGIGGGLIINGRIVHGAGHPEMGHVFPRRGADDRAFAGICPFHGDCLEGLASGPAILARWGHTLSELPQDHEAHELVAGYLAQLCHMLFATAAIETVVMGGGVMKTPKLLELVASKARANGAGYLPGRNRQKIVAPALGQDAGITGALLLAEKAKAD